MSKVSNTRIPEEEFLQMRRETLSAWPTGKEVDFDEAIARGRMYGEFERHAYESACNLYKKEVE